MYNITRCLMFNLFHPFPLVCPNDVYYIAAMDDFVKTLRLLCVGLLWRGVSIQNFLPHFNALQLCMTESLSTVWILESSKIAESSKAVFKIEKIHGTRKGVGLV